MFKKTAQSIGEEAAKSAINTAKDIAKKDTNDYIKKITPILGLIALYICFTHVERSRGIVYEVRQLNF